MKVPVHDKSGKAGKQVDLPPVFATPYRTDLILKAVSVSRANRRQRYGTSPMAGARHATASAGKGRGLSRVPRKWNNSGALAPGTIGGRRAHPPEARRSFKEKINDKERRLAIASALAATANVDMVRARGHRFKEGLATPVVLADDALKQLKAKDAIALLVAVGVSEDTIRAKENVKERPGVGKMRGRRLKKPKSLLIVTESPDDGRGFANLVGVDVVPARSLNAELLAPGGHAGRLVLFSESSLKSLSNYGVVQEVKA